MQTRSSRAVRSLVPDVVIALAVLTACRGEALAAEPAKGSSDERRAATTAQAELAWQSLMPGVEYATPGMPAPIETYDKRLHVVRIDPAVAQLRVGIATKADSGPRTAKEWCRDRGLAVAINAGMYQQDFRTHVGTMRVDGVVNSSRWVSKYNSVLAFGPKEPGLARAVMLDREGLEPASLDAYGTVVQNLRLIRGEGVNAWTQSERQWSESAIGMDGQGRLLFLHSRAPYSMHDFNAAVLAMPLGIVRAMHVEGGPEASLSIHAGGVDLDLMGSYETGFNEHDGVVEQWQIPIVIGVVATK